LERNNLEEKYKYNYYAKSFFDLAMAEDAVIQVEDEMEQLKDELLDNIDLKRFLTNNTIPVSEKIKSMLNFFGKQASNTIKDFISTIIINNFYDHVEEIYRDYVSLIDIHKKQVNIEVISAIELDKKTIDKVKTDIDKKSGLDVRIKNIVDKEIVGGIVIKIGQRVIDLSLKNKIDDLKEKLKVIELRGEDFGIKN